MYVVPLLGVLLLDGVSSAAEVRLRPTATCGSTVVRLADVAEIEAADASLAAALGEIPLCPAPAVGGERSLSQHDVRQLLVLSGVERADVNVGGSERVTIQAEKSLMHPAPQAGAAGVRQAAFQTQAKKAQPAAPEPPADKLAKREQLVDRGANVSVYARAAGVRIATSGKALQPGAAGETILVEMENKEKVQARVVAAQAVEVAVPGKNGVSR